MKYPLMLDIIARLTYDPVFNPAADPTGWDQSTQGEPTLQHTIDCLNQIDEDIINGTPNYSPLDGDEYWENQMVEHCRQGTIWGCLALALECPTHDLTNTGSIIYSLVNVVSRGGNISLWNTCHKVPKV